MEPVLVLFDIDGTILDGGGSGRLAMERAFARLYGAEDAGEGVPTAGRCDRAIFADMAGRAGVALDAAALEAVVAAYLDELPAAMAERGARVLPGVRRLVEALAVEARCRLAVGTGNVAAGAAIKLRHAGVDRFFPTGAFGDSLTDRGALIGEALRRARAHYGQAFPPSAALVVGDAEADVEAARANGMRVLSVATGRTPAGVLAAARPDVLLPDLRDTARIVAWILAHADGDGDGPGAGLPARSGSPCGAAPSPGQGAGSGARAL